MLVINVGETEFYDEARNEFVLRGGTRIQLEHSLVSLSKWESIFEVPFLTKDSKTEEQALEYVKCMIMTPDVAPEVFSQLTEANFEAINEYINAKQSATWFNDPPGQRPPSREKFTAELIYYWMASAGIPKECENWHLNRLFNLIRIYGIKNSKPTKQSRSEMMSQRARLNAERRAAHGSSG